MKHEAFYGFIESFGSINGHFLQGMDRDLFPFYSVELSDGTNRYYSSIAVKFEIRPLGSN